MQQSTPYFSIVIPTYNRAAFVKQAIESVLLQDFTRFEILIVDDGSTDSTQEVLRSYADRIKSIYQENKGPEQARNIGIRAAVGEYVVFLDSDDLLFPHALTVYHDSIIHSEAALIIAQGSGFRDASEIALIAAHMPVEYIISKDYLSKKQSTWLSTSFLVIKRRCCSEHAIFFNSLTYPVDDLDFLLRAGTLGPCIFIQKPVTVGYRIHTSNSVHDIKKNINRLKIIHNMEKKGEYPGGLRRKFDRLACIGGHLQSWFRMGLKAGFYKESVVSLVKGFWPLLALILKKIVNSITAVSRKSNYNYH